MDAEKEEKGLIKIEEKALAKIQNDTDLKKDLECWNELTFEGIRYESKVMEIAIRQGEILTKIKKKFGEDGLKAFCAWKGVSQASRYRLLRYYAHEDDPFIHELFLGHATTYLKVKELPGVEQQPDGTLILPKTKERLTIKAISGMTEEGFQLLHSELKKTIAERDNLKKIGVLNEKENTTMKKGYRRLQIAAGVDPNNDDKSLSEKLIQRLRENLDKSLAAAKELLDDIPEAKRLTTDQAARIQGELYRGEAVFEEYHEKVRMLIDGSGKYAD